MQHKNRMKKKNLPFAKEGENVKMKEDISPTKIRKQPSRKLGLPHAVAAVIGLFFLLLLLAVVTFGLFKLSDCGKIISTCNRQGKTAGVQTTIAW